MSKIVRQLVFFSLFSMVVLTTWYNYATPTQRAVLPLPLQTAIIATDTGFKRGVSAATRALGQALTRTQTHSTDSSVSVTSQANNIQRVYEIPSAQQDELFKDSMLLGATLKGANLSAIDLENALIDGADASQASFSETQMKGASARLTIFHQAVFHRTDLSDVSMEGADFERAILVEVKLSSAQFERARFDHTMIRGGSAIGANFNSSTLTHSTLNAIDMRRATFFGSDLRHTNFHDVQLHGARFDGANLTGSNLRNTTGLTQLALSGACGDATTHLPSGLSVVACDQPSPVAMAGTSQAPHTTSIAASNTD